MVILVLFLSWGGPLLAENWLYCLGEDAVILEYESVYSVHNEPDPVNYPNMRAQPGRFDVRRILEDLRRHIETDTYDFVLLYTLQEVPGWISGGKSFSQPLGKNIGFFNSGSGTSWAPEGWQKLRSVPHMNDVAFIARTSPNHYNFGGTLTAFHECFHYWGPNMTHNYTIGPREWTSDMPLAWLAQTYYHWSWNFVDTAEEKLPGIMASGPTSDRFNAFDLYIMGLLGYEQASKHSYVIHEWNEPLKQHTLTLDHMIEAVSLLGDLQYEGDGKRIPDTDPSASHFKCLLVIIKGHDESLTHEDVDLVLNMAADIPDAWEAATWGLSSMSLNVERKRTALPEPDKLNFELLETGVNISHYLERGRSMDIYVSSNLRTWDRLETVKGEGRVLQRYHPRGSGPLFFRTQEISSVSTSSPQ